MSDTPTVTLIATGVANLASVEAAFARLGARTERTVNVARIEAAEALVLPGVGAFEPGIRFLRENGLDEILRERVESDRPLLSVCLGMQLLCESSEEARSESRGLGIVPGRLRRFPDQVRVPQLGWNRVRVEGQARFLADGAAYFANSFRLPDVPEGFTCALAEHSGPFVAALERGRLLACQFHPELSGAFGEALLQRWLSACTEEVTSC